MFRKYGLILATAALFALTTAANAKDMLISVNCDVSERDEGVLDGPFDGDGGSDVGTTWNQILRGPGRSWDIDGILLQDSTGAATTVNFRVSKNGHSLGCWAWGTPDLAILTSAITGWDPDIDSYDLVFSGLAPGTMYDLYLASFHPNENGGRALFSTANATTTEIPQIVDNGGSNGNDSTWIKGENYTLFEKVKPDGNGEIIIHVYSDWTTDSTKRAYVSGFQLTTSIIPTAASFPNPGEEQADVSRDSDLSWTPGIFAAQHNVYVGDTYEGVDTATVPAAAGLDVNAFDPGRLEFGKTYYWRVDEVNGTPDKTVYKGNVWSFQVEPYSIVIPVDVSKATASSFTGKNTPDMTVNGSGLEGSTHSENSDTMWLSAPGDVTPWLMYEFDQIQKLDQMLIWNSNSKSEVFIGWGIKDVNIEVSVDGVDWTSLAESSQVSKAPGAANYSSPQVIDLGLALAKYVRLNILSNWGGLLKQYGVSEVRFYGLPVYARTPDPASGSADVLPNAAAAWRAGREADQHIVYLDTDAEAVAKGSAASVTPGTNRVALDSFGVELGETYYWRVDEANDTEAMSVWQGPVWNFSIVPSVTIDDFESYSNKSPNRPFQTWLDGFGYSADDFFPQDYAGNGTGAGIGHDVWSPGSPYFDGSIMETERTIAGSDQSMPLYYNNTGGPASETQRGFTPAQDWTVGGPQLLSIAFFGEAENTGTLYAKINGTKVTYPLEPTHIAAQTWKTWNIDLSTLGINLQSVTSLAIGVDGSGASGMLLIDDIVLRKKPAGPAETVSLFNDFDSLPAGSSMDGVPGWEGWFGDAQWAGKITDTLAYSGTNSLEIVGTRDDVVPNWPLVENGVYEATVMQYVPTGTDGSMYFGPLSSYGATWDDTAWLGTLLSNCTTGFVYINELDAGTRTQAPLLRDQWVRLKIVMNFDANACDFYYGDTLLGSLECPSAMGFDIWPDDDVDVIYFDDFSFKAQ